MQSTSEDRERGTSGTKPGSSQLHAQDVPGRLRIRHACDRCRAMRGRCTGGLRCEGCIHDNATCTYSDRKREHNKQITAKAGRIEDLESDKAQLVGALKDLSNHAALKPDHRFYLDTLLQKVSEDAQAQGSSANLSSQSPREASLTSDGHGQIIQPIFDGAERTTVSKVGSPGSEADTSQKIHLEGGSGMVGYIGKMSETSWMRRILNYLDYSTVTLDPQIEMDIESPAPSIAPGLTYFMDEENVLSINEDDVNYLQKPSLSTSLLLTEAFFHSLQGAFPFVPYKQFHDILDKVMSEDFPSAWEQVRQLALCNMVWAAGARWLQRSDLWHGTFAEDHLIYYARARALGCDHRLQFEHPDVQLLQSIAIMAFYLLLNGSLQRAWNVLGQAIRHAISLGLHLSNTSDPEENEEQETKKSLWYALFRLETFLGEVLGRPTCIQHAVIVGSPALQPIQADDALSNYIYTLGPGESRTAWIQFLEQHGWKPGALDVSPGLWMHFPTANSGVPPSYLSSALSLSRISTEIATNIFSNPSQRTWFQVQCSIAETEAILHAWSRDLAQELRVENLERIDFDHRHTLELALNLCSMEMLLYRPCLCNIEIKYESMNSHEFNVLRARFCVLAAVRMMMDLMPQHPVAAQILQLLPCWSTLHYICQAGSVLLLEICLGMQHLPTEVERVASALRKVLEYLWILSPHFKSAHRAYHIFRALAERVSAQFRVGSLLLTVAEPVAPPQWSESEEEEMTAILNTLSHRKPG